MPDATSRLDDGLRAGSAREFAGAQVTVLEYDGSVLVVRWVEPGIRHFGEQRWRRAIASRRGVCVLSHLPIFPGDAVFRPAERPRPTNAGAMILASDALGVQPV
ncbi:DUF3331 domain-containing protein [Burkholderia contaminans]|uniref:DUF3331 domain-containing protein n=1 Tax=Burkholderia contaminans TaxID=488447 RepID=UPI000F59590F|nr:DUF3331 domain-containing protein [Burkholderia contaminans]RQT19096.1 DUF3331 domain-containing protein [Burkholderia contaminans]